MCGCFGKTGEFGYHKTTQQTPDLKHQYLSLVKQSTNEGSKGNLTCRGCGGLIREHFGIWFGGFSIKLGHTTSTTAKNMDIFSRSRNF